MKPCPYCAEEIQDAAIFCRFCGNDTRIPVPPPKIGNGDSSKGFSEDIDRSRTEKTVEENLPSISKAIDQSSESFESEMKAGNQNVWSSAAKISLVLYLFSFAISLFGAGYYSGFAVSAVSIQTLVIVAIIGFVIHVPIYAAVLAIWKRLRNPPSLPPLEFRTYLISYFGGVLLIGVIALFSIFIVSLVDGSPQANSQEYESPVAISPTNTSALTVGLGCIPAADVSQADYQSRVCVTGVVGSSESAEGGNTLVVLAGNNLAILDRSRFPTIYPAGTCVWGTGVIRSSSSEARFWLELEGSLKRCESAP